MTLRLLMLAVLSVAATTTQAETVGRLHGLAKDETGRPLAGVTADVHAMTGSAGWSATTDPQGGFTIAGLPPGRYQVAFRLPSFATTVRTVKVGAGSTVEVEATLRIALNADVLVTGKRTFRSLTDLDEPANGLLGLAEAGSTGVVTAQQIEERPVFRSGEVYEAVPGVVVSQHSGEGKANQYYVRGFNIDHGTDLATWVAGAPVNMPTHAHGQGWSLQPRGRGVQPDQRQGQRHRLLLRVSAPR